MPQIRATPSTSEGSGIWIGSNEEALQMPYEELYRLFRQLYPEPVDITAHEIELENFRDEIRRHSEDERQRVRENPLKKLSEKYKESDEELNY